MLTLELILLWSGVYNVYRAQESVVDEVEEQDEKDRQGRKFLAPILVMARAACLK